MSSTKEQRVSSPLTSELAVDEREGRLQCRQERGGHVVCTSIGLLSYRLPHKLCKQVSGALLL